MLLWLLALAAPAQDDPGFVGPTADHRVMHPVGQHTEGRLATVPGPTADCVSKAQVFVPWKICRALGSRVEEGPRRMEVPARADPPLPGASCAFVCTPAAKLANWSFVLPAHGYRGRVTCDVSMRMSMSLDVVGSDTSPSVGATIQWQTDLQETTYTLTDPDLMAGDPKDLERMIYEAERRLDGPNACPAGQPRRLP